MSAHALVDVASCEQLISFHTLFANFNALETLISWGN
jgi:hypothetical protein